MTALHALPGGKARPTSTAGRIPVHDERAEDALLGMFLLGTIRPSVVEDVITGPEIFYGESNARIWRAIAAATAANPAYEFVHVCTALQEHGDGALVTRATALLERVVDVTDERRARSFAQTIRNRWLQRRLGWEAERIASLAYDAPSPTPYSLIDDALESIRTIERDTIANASVVSSVDTVRRVVERLSKGRIAGVLSGIEPLDAITTGFHPAQVTLIAARTSVGKSMLAAQIACSAARVGHAVLYVTLEMAPETVTERMLSFMAGVHSARLHKRTLDQSEWGRLHAAGVELASAPLRFNTTQTMFMREIADTAAAYAKELALKGQPLGMIVVDHVGLVRPADPKQSREQQVADTSRKLRALAEVYRCPVVGLAQIGRDAEKRSGAERIPRLHDLRESGSLEQDADTVLILHRARDAKGIFDLDAPADLVVAKARVSGECGHIQLKCEPQFMRFSPWEYA